MSVRYKFKSEKNFSQILFDGIHISVADLKTEIYFRRKLGRSENVDLMISNAENKQQYIEDDCLIPKNTSLIVVRVPVTNSTDRSKKVFSKFTENPPQSKIDTKVTKFSPISTNLLTMKGTEEEKIFAMMMQSTLDYQGYQRPVQNQFSIPPATYVCRMCHIPGHWIRNCEFAPQKTHRFDPKARREINKMTGIPMSMRNKTEGRQFYSEDVKKVQIPQNCYCDICKVVFRSPVRMPCCQTIFCNECAITKLLETDDFECPKCAAKFINPGMLEEDDEMKNKIEALAKIDRSSFLEYRGHKNIQCS